MAADPTESPDDLGVYSLYTTRYADSLLARGVCTRAEWETYNTTEPFSRLYRSWEVASPSLADDDFRDTIAERVEQAYPEQLTPRRRAAVEAVLAEADEPLTYGEIRERAVEVSGLSFGHGNQILALLRQSERSGELRASGTELRDRRYVLARTEALDPEYEQGPGRCE